MSGTIAVRGPPSNQLQIGVALKAGVRSECLLLPCIYQSMTLLDVSMNRVQAPKRSLSHSRHGLQLSGILRH